MVERTPAGSSPIGVALTRVPDLPRWIDTRGMLLSGRAAVHMPSRDGATPGAPVWGALEANSGARALAARLGFLEAGGVAVFTET